MKSTTSDLLASFLRIVEINVEQERNFDFLKKMSAMRIFALARKVLNDLFVVLQHPLCDFLTDGRSIIIQNHGMDASHNHVEVIDNC